MTRRMIAVAIVFLLVAPAAFAVERSGNDPVDSIEGTPGSRVHMGIAAADADAGTAPTQRRS